MLDIILNVAMPRSELPLLSRRGEYVPMPSKCCGKSGLSRSPNRPDLHHVLFAYPNLHSRRLPDAISSPRGQQQSPCRAHGPASRTATHRVTPSPRTPARGA